MKTLRVIYFMVFLSAVLLLIAPAWWSQPRPGAKAPVITNAYAADKGQYGTIWKIYLEAEAGDAEMVKIATVVDQPGEGLPYLLPGSLHLHYFYFKGDEKICKF